MNLPLQSDRDSLMALAKGDQQAIRLLYYAHRKSVVSWICKRGGEEQDAEDVFQEAMVVLYEKAQQETFRLSCKISTYLFAVSKHLWYKKLQHHTHKHTSYAEEHELEQELDNQYQYGADADAHWEREAQYSKMALAMEQLGAPCNQLLKAFYMDQKSMKEIAEQFGYTNPDNAKTQKYKCLNRLKKIFSEASTLKMEK